MGLPRAIWGYLPGPSWDQLWATWGHGVFGYGVSLGGISALLTMLNSCSPGVGVVNVDNGFGGAVWAMKCLR